MFVPHRAPANRVLLNQLYTESISCGFPLAFTVKRKPGIENIDVLVDGEYIDEYKSPDKHWVGSSNQNVIDVKASMKENKLVLWKEG